MSKLLLMLPGLKEMPCVTPLVAQSIFPDRLNCPDHELWGEVVRVSVIKVN